MAYTSDDSCHSSDSAALYNSYMGEEAIHLVPRSLLSHPVYTGYGATVYTDVLPEEFPPVWLRLHCALLHMRQLQSGSCSVVVEHSLWTVFCCGLYSTALFIVS